MSTEPTFEQDGYKILRQVFSDEQLKPIRELVDRIIKVGEMELEDPFNRYYLKHRVDQGVLSDLYQRHPEFSFMVHNSTILDCLETVLGPDIMLYENSLVYKPKGKKNEVPWHQDFINRPDEPLKLVVWIALDDVLEENGAMNVIPGSHKSGFLDWHRVKGNAYHDLIDPKLVDTTKVTKAELFSGDVLIFHQLLLHSSKNTNSDKPRRAFRISYQNLEYIVPPRGAPIVVRGGSPETIASLYQRSEREAQIPAYKEVLHKIGKRLLKI